jgi:hypothetical protein
MDYQTIAVLVIKALSPIAKKGLEKLAEKTAEEGFNERKAIWEKIKGLFKTDDLTLLNLLQDADSDLKAQGMLEDKLETHLETTPEIAKFLEPILARLTESASTQIMNEQIADSEISNKLKRSPETRGQAAIENTDISGSRIDNEIDIS